MPQADVHINITKAAMNRSLGLPSELMDSILEGVLDPDKVPDKWIIGEWRTPAALEYVQQGESTTSYSHRHKYTIEVPVDHYNVPTRLIEYYFNLSLYHLRRGDRRKAGLMLGRALHYVQDASFKHFMRKSRGVDESARLVAVPRDIEALCRYVIVSDKGKYSGAEESLCMAYKRSLDLLNRFVREYQKPVNVHEIKSKIRIIRFVKLCAFIALMMLGLRIIEPLLTIMPLHAFIAVVILMMAFIGGIIINIKTKTHYEAMRAGLTILKPSDRIHTAY